MKGQKNKIYCGNNQFAPELTKGTHNIGTPYACMRKGIGVGLNLPLDESAAGPYEPIVKKDFYCGKEESKIPVNLSRRGNPTECLRAGIAIGKAKKAKEQISRRKSRNRKKRAKKKRRYKRKKSMRKKSMRKKSMRKNEGFSTRLQYGVFVKYVLPILIIVCTTLAFSLPLYYSKPKFLLSKKDQIDMEKYFIVVYLFLLFISLIVILIWKYYIL